MVYPPSTSLRSEGLGRHLAEFLYAAQSRNDISFVIACPSWLRAELLRLFAEFNIHPETFLVISPIRQPWVLSIYELLYSLRNKPTRKSKFTCIREYLSTIISRLIFRISLWLAGARNREDIALVAVSTIMLAVLSPFILVTKLALFFIQKLVLIPRKYSFRLIRIMNSFRLSSMFDILLTYLYPLMTEAEAVMLVDMINDRDDVISWYSPTAFWPWFNKIKAPHCMCVPDVVLTAFPVSFALSGNARMVEAFNRIGHSIRSGTHFITYSETVKWNTLVNEYQVHPNSINVIRHGSNCMDKQISDGITVLGSSISNSFCYSLFKSALSKSCNPNALTGGLNVKFKFIFYASQIRPNKNVLSLLKAYEYLLRKKNIAHKLVLTGNPKSISSVSDFIMDNNLQYDVIFLNGISNRELAACYRLADLAVNPSFSEGGCPFTFTEALSVSTPVVMAQIAVTEEIIVDSELHQLMLFDPYEWKDMAERIEWALNNLGYLLKVQSPHYEKLAARTWRNVVDDHIVLFDEIAKEHSSKA